MRRWTAAGSASAKAWSATAAGPNSRMRGAAAATALKIAAAPVSVVPANRNASAPVSATLRAGPGQIVLQRVDVPAVVDRDALALGGLLDLVGDPAAVDLAVGEQREAARAEDLHVADQRRGLHVVGGHDAAERALAGRVEAIGLALAAARAGEPVVRARGADLQDVALVGQRHRQRGGRRVAVADVGDRVEVADRLAGVVEHLVAGPGLRPGLRRVQRHVRDRERADLAAGLLQGELDRVDHVARPRAVGPLQRQARVDRQRVRAVLDGAALVVAAAAGRAGSEHEYAEDAGDGRPEPAGHGALSWSVSGRPGRYGARSLAVAPSVMITVVIRNASNAFQPIAHRTTQAQRPTVVAMTRPIAAPD